MRKMTVFLTLLIFALSASAMAADISGDWQLKRVGPKGEETWDLTFAANGSEFTVAGTQSELGEVTGSGTLDGNNIKMLTYLITEVGRIHVQFEGVVDGNEMSGSSQSVGLDPAGGGGGAPGGAPEGAPKGSPSDGAPGGPPGGGAPEGGQPGGGSSKGGVDHTQPIAFTGAKK